VGAWCVFGVYMCLAVFVDAGGSLKGSLVFRWYTSFSALRPLKLYSWPNPYLATVTYL